MLYSSVITYVGGEDYQDLNRSVVLGAGEGRRCLAILIIPDKTRESDESFEVGIEGTTSRITAEVTIKSEDGMNPLLVSSQPLTNNDI